MLALGGLAWPASPAQALSAQDCETYAEYCAAALPGDPLCWGFDAPCGAADAGTGEVLPEGDDAAVAPDATEAPDGADADAGVDPYQAGGPPWGYDNLCGTPDCYGGAGGGQFCGGTYPGGTGGHGAFAAPRRDAPRRDGETGLPGCGVAMGRSGGSPGVLLALLGLYWWRRRSVRITS